MFSYQQRTECRGSARKKNRLSIVLPWKKDIEKYRRYQPKAPPLEPTCRHTNTKLQCNTLSGEEVTAFYKRFYYTRDRKIQDAFILRHCEGRSPRSKKSGVGKRRRNVSGVYFVSTRERKVRVCRNAFAGILRIKGYRINYVLRMFHKEPEVKKCKPISPLQLKTTTPIKNRYPKKKVTFAKRAHYKHLNEEKSFALIDESRQLEDNYSFSSNEDLFNFTKRFTDHELQNLSDITSSDSSKSKRDQQATRRTKTQLNQKPKPNLDEVYSFNIPDPSDNEQSKKISFKPRNTSTKTKNDSGKKSSKRMQKVSSVDQNMSNNIENIPKGEVTLISPTRQLNSKTKKCLKKLIENKNILSAMSPEKTSVPEKELETNSLPYNNCSVELPHREKMTNLNEPLSTNESIGNSDKPIEVQTNLLLSELSSEKCNEENICNREKTTDPLIGEQSNANANLKVLLSFSNGSGVENSMVKSENDCFINKLHSLDEIKSQTEETFDPKKRGRPRTKTKNKQNAINNSQDNQKDSVPSLKNDICEKPEFETRTKSQSSKESTPQKLVCAKNNDFDKSCNASVKPLETFFEGNLNEENTTDDMELTIIGSQNTFLSNSIENIFHAISPVGSIQNPQECINNYVSNDKRLCGFHQSTVNSKTLSKTGIPRLNTVKQMHENSSENQQTNINKDNKPTKPYSIDMSFLIKSKHKHIFELMHNPGEGEVVDDFTSKNNTEKIYNKSKIEEFSDVGNSENENSDMNLTFVKETNNSNSDVQKNILQDQNKTYKMRQSTKGINTKKAEIKLSIAENQEIVNESKNYNSQSFFPRNFTWSAPRKPIFSLRDNIDKTKINARLPKYIPLASGLKENDKNTFKLPMKSPKTRKIKETPIGKSKAKPTLAEKNSLTTNKNMKQQKIKSFSDDKENMPQIQTGLVIQTENKTVDYTETIDRNNTTNFDRSAEKSSRGPTRRLGRRNLTKNIVTTEVFSPSLSRLPLQALQTNSRV